MNLSYSTYIVLLFLFLTPVLSKSQSTSENLVVNGDFEMGEQGFKSDLLSDPSLRAGTYAVSRSASSLSKDLLDPVGGDHTSGSGKYFVANANGRKGQRVWYTTVTVQPNCKYIFKMNFCNLFKHKPSKTSFEFSTGDIKGNDPQVSVSIGNQNVVVERDFYHVWRWVGADAIWYSGSTSGQVYITIENLNTSVFGNDLAIDDIGFYFVQQMDPGFRPPIAANTLVAVDYVAAKRENEVRKRKLSDLGIFDFTDTLASGVYTIRYKSLSKILHDTVKREPEKVRLQSLIFNQGRAYLLPPAIRQLDLIAEWMKSDSTINVRFTGHTDNQGDSLLNVKLSEERVRNVKSYLISKGIAAGRIEILGVGSAFPVADNRSEEARRLNRRVEMEVLYR